jgi:hypothetical protein
MRNARRFPEAFKPFDFAWDVSATGYRWISATSIDQPDPPVLPDRDLSEDERAFYELDLIQAQACRWLTDGLPSGHPKRLTRYVPLRDKALFRQFAATKITEDAIAAFANGWGSLLGSLGSMVRLERSGGDTVLVRGEEFGRWVTEILRMREAIELWEGARRGDRMWLSRFIRWRACGDVVYEGPRYEGTLYPRGELIADPKLSPNVLKEFARGDVVKPALFYVQRVVNDRLEIHTSMLLLWHHGQLRRCVVPKTLLGCLWLQLSGAIDGDRHYRRCQNPMCERWFELSPSSRSDTLYCSAACKQAEHRRRHERLRSPNLDVTKKSAT